MKKNNIILMGIIIFLSFPVITLAILTPVSRPADNLILDAWQLVNNILDFIWPVFVASVIIMFIFSGFMFVTSAGDPGKMKLAKDAFVFAIIGIIVAIFAFTVYEIIGRGSISVLTAPSSSTTTTSGACCVGGVVGGSCALFPSMEDCTTPPSGAIGNSWIGGSCTPSPCAPADIIP